MYGSFIARNFRCFRELKIDNLSRINLIAGKNNVGKSALLEALFLHCGAYNPSLAFSINAFRGMETTKVDFTKEGETPWDSLFNDFDTSRCIELVGDYKKIDGRVLWLRLIKSPSELSKIHPPITRHLTEAKTIDSSPEVVKVLELRFRQRKKEGSFYIILERDGAFRQQPLSPPPPFPASFQPSRVRAPVLEEGERFGNLEKQGLTHVLVEALKILEPRLKRLVMIYEAKQPVLYGVLESKTFIRSSLMGEGVSRLLSLVLQLFSAQNGVVLIDEIENGLHHSVMQKVWQKLIDVARKFNTQVFATTHSHECIIAAFKAFEGNKPNDFRLHRLEMINGDIKAITYSPATIRAAIEADLELR